MYLENINQPSDVKKLSMDQLNILAQEIRTVLMKRMSIKGGHFGPNFGVVEATIALHYVFHSPVDKIVFDVSHQSYCHKILTGRKDAYLIPERYDEVSGYSCPEESEHDFFNVGHTSTSVSLACGLAKARDLVNGDGNVIAFIGDGALSGGEAFEGLDFAHELNSNLIVVVNDNGMSIAENHGGLYQNLKNLRDTDGTYDCNYFKTLGFDYHFVKNGHNIAQLIDVFMKVKDTKYPTVVHICTTKGKGYCLAEKNKEDWHFRPPFYPENGNTRRVMAGENYDDIACEFLLHKMKQDPKVVAVVAAVPATIGFTREKRELAGKQFVDVGIAEEHAIAMVAGIAKGGCKPVLPLILAFIRGHTIRCHKNCVLTVVLQLC